MKVRETNEIRELSIEELNSATGGLAILKVMGDLVEKNQPCHTKQICGGPIPDMDQWRYGGVPW
jgi:hypothetical protein